MLHTAPDAGRWGCFPLVSTYCVLGPGDTETEGMVPLSQELTDKLRFSAGGCSASRGHWMASGDILGCPEPKGRGWYWSPGGGGQGMLLGSYHTHSSPTTKNSLTPSGNPAEVEKPWMNQRGFEIWCDEGFSNGVNPGCRGTLPLLTLRLSYWVKLTVTPARPSVPSHLSGVLRWV